MGDGRTEPAIEIAVDSRDVSPESISLGNLTAILNAIGSTFDALARERGTNTPKSALVSVYRGSAAYRISGDDEDFETVAAEFCRAAASGGEKNGPDARRGLVQLYRSMTKLGPIRIAPFSVRTLVNQKPFRMPQPLEPEANEVTFRTIMYGRIEGALRHESGGEVLLLLEDGARQRLRGTWEMVDEAVSLFGRTVRSEVEAVWDGQKTARPALLSLDPWEEEDFLSVISRARKTLERSGKLIDAEKLIRELDE